MANTASVGFSLAAGLTIATGTDCPGSCALVGREVEYLVNLHGLDPLEAIKCATANGPLALMVRQENLGMAPLSGQLKEGFVADVIALRSSPLENIAVLKEADSVTHVWRGGELFTHLIGFNFEVFPIGSPITRYLFLFLSPHSSHESCLRRCHFPLLLKNNYGHL